MAVFYSAGTVSVVNGSATVTGVGTGWTASNVKAGSAFQVRNPNADQADYEVESVVSATQLTLTRIYQGSSLSGIGYQVKPGAGVTQKLADAINAQTAAFDATLTGIAAGVFPGGSPSSPALRFAADQDTGLYRSGENLLDLVTGGATRARVSDAGLQVIGLLSGGAVQQNPMDTTDGRALTVGNAFGLGGLTQPIGNAASVANDHVTTAYRYIASQGDTGLPAGLGQATVYHARRGAGGGETQLVVVEGSSDPRYPAGAMLGRARVTGSWGPWRDPGIESVGAANNSRYIRYTNRWATCIRTGLTTSASDEVSWDFPISFAEGWSIQLTVVSASGLSLSPRAYSRDGLGCRISVYGRTDNRVATTVDCLAAGFWV